MPRAVKIDTEYVKKRAVKTIQQVEQGEITPQQAQAISSLLSKITNAISTESQTAEVKQALERLSVIEKCLVNGDVKTLQRLIDEEDKYNAERTYTAED